MLPNVQLPFHPDTINCLAWSNDGELAVAAGEFVHILASRFPIIYCEYFLISSQLPRSREPGRNYENETNIPWEQIQLRVNTFTTDEWSFQVPDTLDSFSIGEEQSTSNVTALAWSPPGLAMHRRSVLAVLTSNLLLSFWVPSSDPSLTGSWERVLVLNNAIKSSWERKYLSKNLSIPTNKFRRKMRLRSMAWSPQFRRSSERNTYTVETRWGSFFLAVANDEGKILLLLISSPYTNGSTSWDSKIVKILGVDAGGVVIEVFTGDDTSLHGSHGRDSIQETQLKKKVEKSPSRESVNTGNNRPSLFKSALGSKPIIDHIAWGSSKTDPDPETIISFTRNGATFHCTLHVSFRFPIGTSLSNVPRFVLKSTSKGNGNSFDLAGRSVVSYNHVCYPFIPENQRD